MTTTVPPFEEDSRVKIPALLHLERLGWRYLSPKLTRLRDWLLPLLINGQVRVVWVV